ncbi:hypothetical protein R3P38DRAFT_2770894 [Favolaschia claudopus]|uniref:Uncharacterized protein n=1 Tax=Favolaschia claudopus TaxID=2862362 RepID=A0AAW0CCW6_9AGAR
MVEITPTDASLTYAPTDPRLRRKQPSMPQTWRNSLTLTTTTRWRRSDFQFAMRTITKLMAQVETDGYKKSGIFNFSENPKIGFKIRHIVVVRATLTLSHWKIGRDKRDTYTADIESLRVLVPASVAGSSSPRKRRVAPIAKKDPATSPSPKKKARPREAASNGCPRHPKFLGLSVMADGNVKR